MRHLIGPGACALLLTLLPTATPAQHRGGVTVTPFGRAALDWPHQYAASSALRDGLGAGLRLGVGVGRGLAVEVEGSQTLGQLAPTAPACGGATICDLTHTALHARVTGTRTVTGPLAVVGGAGGTYQELSETLRGTYWGAHALAGVQLRLSEALALRTEVIHEWMPRGRGGRTAAGTFVQAGVSLRLGRPCQNQDDYLSVGPAESRVTVGATIRLEGDAVTCRRPDLVSYRLQGPGELDPYTGQYTATEPGTAIILATSARGELTTEVRVQVVAPPAPALPTPELAVTVEPLATVDTTPKFVFNVKGIFFRFDDARLNQAGMDTLRIAAKTLVDRPHIEVEVVGHTDHTGPAAYNLKLSKARAMTVTSFLIKEGVASGRITTSWKGETEPIATNATAAGRAMNRRVVIRQTN